MLDQRCNLGRQLWLDQAEFQHIDNVPGAGQRLGGGQGTKHQFFVVVVKSGFEDRRNAESPGSGHEAKGLRRPWGWMRVT